MLLELYAGIRCVNIVLMNEMDGYRAMLSIPEDFSIDICYPVIHLCRTSETQVCRGPTLNHRATFPDIDPFR